MARISLAAQLEASLVRVQELEGKIKFLEEELARAKGNSNSTVFGKKTEIMRKISIKYSNCLVRCQGGVFQAFSKARKEWREVPADVIAAL